MLITSNCQCLRHCFRITKEKLRLVREGNSRNTYQPKEDAPWEQEKRIFSTLSKHDWRNGCEEGSPMSKYCQTVLTVLSHLQKSREEIDRLRLSNQCEQGAILQAFYRALVEPGYCTWPQVASMLHLSNPDYANQIRRIYLLIKMYPMIMYSGCPIRLLVCPLSE